MQSKNSNDNEEHAMPYFCYMMINLETAQKTNTCIEIAYNPFKAVDKHNESNMKGSKGPAARWTLDMIIGPFSRMKDTTSFETKWKFKSRGIRSRRERAVRLAREQKLTCWANSLPK